MQHGNQVANSTDISGICNLSADVCGQEPIHLPGAIQPHGLLAGIDGKTLGLVTKSANADTIFPETPLDAFPSWLPPEVGQVCRDMEQSGSSEHKLMAKIAGQGLTEVHCFASSGLVFCEFELSAGVPMFPVPDEGSLIVAKAIKQMETAKDLSELASIVADSVRAISGFERVMVYRFEFDGDGEVAGESLAQDWDQSFLGLRFPASDIPPQARALYRVSHARWLPTRDYEPALLTPGEDRAGKPFDLSLSLYRSISPAHRAYQKNIGADGAMSLSVICDEVLWGLVIGHHRRPHRVSAATRHHVDAIVGAFNIMLGGRLDRATKENRQSGRPSHSAILAKLAVAEEFLGALTEDEPSIVELLPGCVGAALVWDDNGVSRVRTLDETPPPDDVAALTAWVRSAAREPVFACDCISDYFPLFLAHRERASGILAIFFQDVRQPVLLLFRPEVIRSVSWAGKPEKLVDPGGGLSLPRRSFDLWIEAKRNHSQPWRPGEIDIAADVFSTVNHVLVHEARRIRLKEAEQAALEASRAKSDFLANMSHEIRTPMNAIVGLTRMLRRDIHDPVQSGKLEKIDRSAHYLIEIINHILDISKIEAGKLSLHRENFSLRDLISGVVSQIGAEAEQKGLNLRIESSANFPDRLHGDALRIRQCLLNYLSNAVKFTDTGSVVIRAGLERRIGAGMLVRFEVEDTGIGIEPQALKRLFSPFEQADTSITRKFGGTGLGLAITRRLATLMGGEAGGGSTPGKGSLFFFSALLQPASGLTSSAGPSVEPAAKPDKGFGAARVLIAEDVELNREILMDMLKVEGFNASIAENGEIAVNMAAAAQYDLIFMDMQMPVMDGLSATRAIRQLPGYRHTPIIAVTANAFEKSREECRAAGMNHFLCKPLDPRQLHTVLLLWLKKETATGAVESHASSVADRVDADLVASLRSRLGGIADIDLESGLRQIEPPERYIRYLVKYAEKYETISVRMRALLADGDPLGASRLAHSLKGASAQLGVVGIRSLAAVLEEAIKNQAGNETIETLVKQTEERCSGVCAAIVRMGALSMPQ
jgi:light-regulated signal transduction histidine kinase (bacteriophytochrome)/DNA-binding NarL/FixJ family response regulator/HPt (histidine-containing phosphotransfer) domain-containing protein